MDIWKKKRQKATMNNESGTNWDWDFENTSWICSCQYHKHVSAAITYESAVWHTFAGILTQWNRKAGTCAKYSVGVVCKVTLDLVLRHPAASTSIADQGKILAVRGLQVESIRYAKQAKSDREKTKVGKRNLNSHSPRILIRFEC